MHGDLRDCLWAGFSHPKIAIPPNSCLDGFLIQKERTSLLLEFNSSLLYLFCYNYFTYIVLATLINKFYWNVLPRFVFWFFPKYFRWPIFITRQIYTPIHSYIGDWLTTLNCHTLTKRTVKTLVDQLSKIQILLWWRLNFPAVGDKVPDRVLIYEVQWKFLKIQGHWKDILGILYIFLKYLSTQQLK